jgi:cysteine desulfurase
MVPLYKGGGQERGQRSGTEAPELAHAFAAALGAAANGRERFRASAKRNRDLLITLLVGTIKNVFIQEGRTQAPHILNISLPGRDTDYLVALLDEAGFALSTRSACETDSLEGSRAVYELTGDREKASATIRISWRPETRSRDLVRFAKALADAVVFIDSNRQR